MELSKLLSILKPNYDPILLDLLQPHWASSAASVPDDWDLLQRANWQEWREWCDCEPQVDATLHEVVMQIATDPQLRLLAWHCYRLIFERSDYNRFGEWPALIPLLEKYLHTSSHAFFLLLALNGVPRLRQKNNSRAVSEQTTRDTLMDIGIGVRRFARYNNGAVGIKPGMLAWYSLGASGELYRLGRFQYIIKPFHARLRVYRHRTSRHVIALSEPDVGYNETGHLPLYDSRRKESQAPSWTSQFHESASVIRGNPISPLGFALPQQIELDATEWQLVLARGDNILIVHIPEGSPLSQESCRDSFQRAKEFFTTRFPECNLNAFVTNSWLLNTQLETMLPSSSHLLAWQRELYLYPDFSTGKDGLVDVFNDQDIDLATAPKDTALRRAIIDHLQAGNTLRSGGMFFFFEELPYYGTQVYCTMQKQNGEYHM